MINHTLYKIVFPNGKLYIGATSAKLERRLKQQIRFALDYFQDYPVHRAIRECGAESIKIEPLVVGNKQYISELENKVVALFKTQDREFGYNVADGGYNYAMSNEVRNKISETLTGTKQSKEHKENVAKARQNKEHKAKVSISLSKRFIEYRGITKSLRQWSEELGINYWCLHRRIYRSSWTVEKAFTTK
jgi:hypothetical protein